MYKCKACKNELFFNPTKQRLECSYCRAEIEVEQYNELLDVNGKQIEEKEGYYPVVKHTCNECGNSVLSFDENIKNMCYCCGSDMNLTRKVTYIRRPKYIIPFKIDKEECKENLEKNIKFSLISKMEIADSSVLLNIKGIYLPHYIYQFEENGHIQATGSLPKGKSGNYQNFEDYLIDADVESSYESEPYCAYSILPNNISSQLGPYDLTEKKEFNPLYMAGSETYMENQNSEQYNKENAAEKMSIYMSDILQKNSNFSKLGSYPEIEIDGDDVQREVALFPAYMVSVKNKENSKISYILVNGQNGNLVADVPIDFTKMMLFSLIATIIVFVIINVFFTVTTGKILGMMMILNCLNLFFVSKQEDKKNKFSRPVFDKANIDKNKIFNKVKDFIKAPKKHIIKPGIGIILSLVLLIMNFRSDIIMTVGMLADIGIGMWAFSDIIINNSKLSYTNLSQVKNNGGEIDA